MRSKTLDALVSLVRTGRLPDFVARARKLDPADLADVLSSLDDADRLTAVRALPPEISGEALVEMPEEAHAEVFQSRRMIEAACGRSPRAFAYPNGRPDDYNPAVLAVVREAGFTCAVTTTFGVNSRSTPPYELRRGGPWEPHLPTFALKLAAYRLTEA